MADNVKQAKLSPIQYIKGLLENLKKENFEKIIVLGVNKDDELITDWANMPCGERVYYLEKAKYTILNDVIKAEKGI